MDEEKRRERFAKRLKEAREKKGLRQNKLADDISVAPQTLSAYENANKLPTLDNAVALAEKLDVSLDWLLGIEKPDDNKTKTLGDVADLLVNWLDNSVIDELSVHMEKRFDNIDVNDARCFDSEYGPYIEEKVATIIIRNGLLAKFIDGWGKMLNLLREGTIDRSLYDSFLIGETAKLNKVSISPWNELADDEGELPF